MKIIVFEPSPVEPTRFYIEFLFKKIHDGTTGWGPGAVEFFDDKLDKQMTKYCWFYRLMSKYCLETIYINNPGYFRRPRNW